MSRCTGHCCRRFRTESIPGLQVRRNAGEAEAAYLLNMLVPLGPPEQATPYFLFGSQWYTCRHLQPSGDCGAYEARPSMCRDYPYGHACCFDGCTWGAAAAGLVDRSGRRHLAVLQAAPPGDVVVHHGLNKLAGCPPLWQQFTEAADADTCR